jgi:hypothetical protein
MMLTIYSAVTTVLFVLFLPLFHLTNSRLHCEDAFVYFLVLKVDSSLFLTAVGVLSSEGTLELVEFGVFLVSVESTLASVSDRDETVNDGLVVVIDLMLLEVREVPIVRSSMGELECAGSSRSDLGLNCWASRINVFLMYAQ